MTKTEAKRRVCALVATRLLEDFTNPDWGKDLTDEDVRRMDDAARDILAEMARRSRITG